MIDALGLRSNNWIIGRQILGRLSEEMRNVLLLCLAETILSDRRLREAQKIQYAIK